MLRPQIIIKVSISIYKLKLSWALNSLFCVGMWVPDAPSSKLCLARFNAMIWFFGSKH